MIFQLFLAIVSFFFFVKANEKCVPFLFVAFPYGGCNMIII